MAQIRAPSAQRPRRMGERPPLAYGASCASQAHGACPGPRSRVRSADTRSPCLRSVGVGAAQRGLLQPSRSGLPSPSGSTVGRCGRPSISRHNTASPPTTTAATSASSRSEPAAYEEDCSEYSDRFLAGYDRGRLLGRGACAVVWLATPTGKRHQTVAIKQVAKGTTGKKRSDTDAARKEIFFGSFLFHEGGEPKLNPDKSPGIKHITRLLEHSETKRDIWMVMEYGGTCLTKMAYEIKGEFHRGERLYRAHHQPLLQAMKQNPSVLKSILRQLLSALQLLADHHIVHSDIKPDNILIEEDERHRIRARFIDLGSAFGFDSPETVAVATPEYMPPEALESCAARSSSMGGTSRLGLGLRQPVPGQTQRRPERATEQVQRPTHPWSFDVWSLGSILLELCLGIPLWMSYKCRVADDQRATTGLFAVPGRDPEKILVKQVEALRQRGLQSVLAGAHGVHLDNDGPGSGQEFLAMMLAWDPIERISPHAALGHKFLQEGQL